jgi:ketosteroid isomerase-like protein
MSQENVELVREGFARWNEGDYEFFLESTAPDVELLSRFGSLRGEPYRGHEGVREWLADIQQSFERFDLGLDMKEPMGWVFEIRDGRLARMRFYAQRSEALEAVGLSE